MKKSIVIVTLAICAVSAVVAWHAHRRLLAADAELDALHASAARAHTARAGTSAPAVAADSRHVAPRKTESRPGSENAPAIPAPSGQPDTAVSLDKFPGLRALFRRSVAGDLSRRYGTFYRSAKLSPEQIEKFERVMTEAQETKMDFELAARAQGYKPTDAALAPQRTQLEASLKTALTDALGSADYEQYQQYQRMMPITGLITDMTTLAVQHDAPLDAAQVDRLMTSIANASPGYRTGAVLDPLTVDWTHVLVEAQPYLSAKQFAVVRQAGDMQQVYQLLKQFYAQKKPAGG